jgi:hypothetical protein
LAIKNVSALNIQSIPTPVFYLGKRNIFRFGQEVTSTSTASIVGAFVAGHAFDLVSDGAASAASIVSALYDVPHVEPVVNDAAASAGSIISATNTGTSFQRNGVDAANSFTVLVSARVYAQRSENEVDSAINTASIVSALVL